MLLVRRRRCGGVDFADVVELEARLHDQIAHGIDIEARISPVRRLRAEEDDERQQRGRENSHKVKRPLVPNAVRNQPHKHRRQERAPEQRQIRQRHPHPALMHVVQVAHARVDQGLERREPHALEDARPQERGVVRARCAAPDAAEDDDDGAEEVQMALPPDAGAGHE